MNMLNRLWRLLATAIGFVLFGMVGMLFQLVLLPYTLKRTEGDYACQLQARAMVGCVWRWFVAYLATMGILSVEYSGMERLGRAGQLVLVNHPSLLDVVLIISRAPMLGCVVKKDLLHNPTMRSQILACGYLPNDDSMELVEKVDALLKGGQSLLVFPEGTRTAWDGQVKMHRGAVSMGLRSASVITPVTIKMHPLNFKKGQPWYHIPKQKVHYEICVGEDIDPQKWLAEKPLPIAARHLNEYLQDYFIRKTT